MFASLSPAKIEAFTREIASYAGETVMSEVIGDTIYIFGSELATLRLFKKYNNVKRNEKTDCGYSENMGSFYFSLYFSI